MTHSIMRKDRPRWTRLQEQLRINKATRVKQPYNHNSESKSFLQQQHELTEQRGHSVDHVELFRETHISRSGQFVLQAATDAHNQMLELQSQPTSKGSQPLFGDEIWETVLGRRLSYSKGLG
ncbi:CACTA en-spm transposon protein [Cucumis melo var. makuwa]|uniref:CACTA en-spm transposon protein n=1 Tax=Cucumis melo var. makuwa TaxID=1194695 RepID=A0A5A7UH71_CUCMM|nr:CACTA en-spm transposon protein [Cucumis melo var. makuwa]TYK12364.1 CACTA en-spm transposon protein [Cucumis melo var. makuwa]